MKAILAALMVLGFCGCTKSAPVLTPIQNVGCQIETAVTGGMSQAVVGALQCSNAAAVQASLMAAFGNANLCQAAPVAGQVKPKGVIGNLACPLAISTAVGFLSNSVPASWGCTGPSASIQGLVSVLTAACEAAIPI